jgi:hypothetical protein
MAQGVLATLLKEPHTARARPTTAIKSEANYKRIFSGDKSIHPLEMYGVVTLLLQRVDSYFRGQAGKLDQKFRNNLKFHTLMILAWTLNGSQTMPSGAIMKIDSTKGTDEQLGAVTDWVVAEFTAFGAEDRTAKDGKFTQRLLANWNIAATKV